MGAVKTTGVTVLGLQCLAGVGKTALALVLAEMLKPRYPDAQFYLDLKGVASEVGPKEAKAQPLTPSAAMAHVVRSYHPTAKLPDSEAEMSGLYRSVLEGQRALLLMDNAKDKQQVEPLIPPSSCLLVTSRRHFTLPGLYPKNLEALAAEDARDLLLKIAPRINSHADTLAKLCGYLPLALRLAASAIAERVDLGPVDYLRRLANAQKRLQLIDASVDLSYELLAPQMQKLFCALAVFPATFDAAAAAAVWAMKREVAQDALSRLVSYSLLQWDEAVARYCLHDLVRLFADARLAPADRDRGQRRHAEHFVTVLRRAKELWKEGVTQGLKLFDLEVENIKAGQAWAAARAEEDPAAAELCSNYPAVGVYVLSLRQHPRERISWLETALAAARRLKNRRSEGYRLGNLGLAYADLGETRRAIEYFEQRLAIAREIGDRRGEGNALGNLGVAYKNLGELRRAIDYQQQRLTIAREIGDRRGEGSTLGNLGIAYAHLDETRTRPDVPWSTTSNLSLSPARLATGWAKATPSATWAWPTQPWARPAAPSSITSSIWLSPARSATSAAKTTHSSTRAWRWISLVIASKPSLTPKPRSRSSNRSKTQRRKGPKATGHVENSRRHWRAEVVLH